MNGATALPIQYAESMIALTVTRFVWPAVTLESQDRDKTNPVVPTPKHHIKKSGKYQRVYGWIKKPVSHCENKRPTLFLHGRKFIKNTPRTLGM